jgi:hypothetical protein
MAVERYEESPFLKVSVFYIKQGLTPVLREIEENN